MTASKGKPTLADTLRRMVRESGEPVASIAFKADVPQPVLHRFVHGEQGLTLTTAEKLLAYFDLEIVPRDRNAKR